MSEKVVGRSQIPSKGRPSYESNAEKSQDSGINVAVQAQFWHNSWTFGLWETFNTWKILIYSLIVWGLYELYWDKSLKTMEVFWPSVNEGIYRFTILAILSTFFLQFKYEVVGAGNTIGSWFAGFQASNPFMANVVEASATVALSTACYQWWMLPMVDGKTVWTGKLIVNTMFHLLLHIYYCFLGVLSLYSVVLIIKFAFVFISIIGFNWDIIQQSVAIVALYVTPIFSLFNGWMKYWTLGGKRGAFMFTYFVFWPIFMILLFIFRTFFDNFFRNNITWTPQVDLVTQLNEAKSSLWTLPFGESSVSVDHGDNRIWVAGYLWPYVPKQAFAWIFWMSHNYIGDNFVPQQWAAAYTFWGNFAWNIVFLHFVHGTWVCDANKANGGLEMQRNCSAFFKL